MSSDDESATKDLDVSERETQFVPRSDDDEVLWEVQEITAERGKKYKVKWSGLDPTTGKPWAQSWVAKHDCTDKLVAEWKLKKKLGTGKKRGRPSTKSRSSVSSKSDRTSTTKKETRPSTSKISSSSRLSLVEEDHDVSPPQRKSPVKRKRQSETPAVETAEPSKLASSSSSVEKFLSPPPKKRALKRKRQSVTPVETSKSGAQVDGRDESESSRPRKKQKSMVEVLLPPLDSDEEDVPPGPKAKAVPRHKSPPKSHDALSDEDSSPPKGKPRALPRKKAPPEDVVVPSEASAFGKAAGPLAPKSKVVPRRNTNNGVRFPRETPPSEPKGVARLKRKSPSEESSRPSEKEVESVVSPPTKVGPPRGVKRQTKQKQPDSLRKPGASRPKARQHNPFDEGVAVEEAGGLFDSWAPVSPMLAQDVADMDPVGPASPLQLPIPQVPVTRPRSDLSPGTRARLDLFDRMIAETDDIHQSVEYDAAYDDHDHYDPPRPPSPPPVPLPKSKPRAPKPGTPNELVVPETESSGNSQTQSQPISKPPSLQIAAPGEPSPRKAVDLPTIAVISASAPPSSPEELLPPPQRHPPAAPSKKATFKPVPHISPKTFRSRLRAVDDAPPSSIESFASPKRVDKGKQKAIEVEVGAEAEVDEVDSDLSDEEHEDLVRARKRTKAMITDSVLRKRGQELSNKEQQRREAERQKNKPAKRLKGIDFIINGTFSSPPMGSSLPFTGGENALELSLAAGDMPDQSEAGHSTTLDTQGQSAEKPLTEEEKERLRIELRQEEEESTQEALGYPMPPGADAGIRSGGDIDMSPSRWSKDSPDVMVRPRDDVDPVEQPSTDLQHVSVLVQASQEQRHEDTDVEPVPTNPPASSPACPIPENLSDSPKRRLGEALSLLNVKSEEIQRLERELDEARKTVRGLEGDLAESRRSPKPSETDHVAAWEAERNDWLEAGEILETQVAVHVKDAEKERAERLALEAERAAWVKEREELVDKMAQQSEGLSILGRIRREQESQWAEERANWYRAGLAPWVKEREELANKIAQQSEELSVLARIRREQELKWAEERANWDLERAVWVKEREELADKMAQQSEELSVLAKIRGEQDQHRLKWESEWAEEKANWELERAGLQEKQETLTRSVDELTGKVESLMGAKVSAEKDRDFFREQYAQASGFVGSVREENLELEKRVKIAEGQAREGVQGIKALFEGRVKALQLDIDRWKGLTELLQEKDRRTNDELRSRAAQAPELEELCGRLTEENNSLEADLRKLGQAQRRTVTQRNKLYFEILMLKKERASLKSKISQAIKMAGSSTQGTATLSQTALAVEDTEIDPNDMEILPDPVSQASQASQDEPALFPCMWRPQWRDQCQHIFDTKEDLERHLQEHFRDLTTP